jgi:hypothetical protein
LIEWSETTSSGMKGDLGNLLVISSWRMLKIDPRLTGEKGCPRTRPNPVKRRSRTFRLGRRSLLYRGTCLLATGLGDLEHARASCEVKPDYWLSQQCLAVVYDKLGRHADAEAVLAKMKAFGGDNAAYQYATIYAQWGDLSKALDWLETAGRLRHPGQCTRAYI